MPKSAPQFERFTLRSVWLSSVSSATRSLCLFLPLMLLAISAFGQVHFDAKSDRVDIQVNGKPFSVLHFGKQAHKPFLHPLLTPSGKNILRGFPVSPLPGDSTDRPHQRGMWMGTEGLKGSAGLEDFWENDPLYPPAHKGAIVFQELTGEADGDDRGVLSFVSHWISNEGQLWIVDRRKITFYTKPTDCRMFDIDIELEARESVTFEDVQDAILGVRLALPFDNHYGGQVTNAEGSVGEEGTRGRRSAWLDWTAELDPKEYQTSPHGHGEKIGVAVFDHPSNLNYPSRWQVKDFGDFSVNPFAGLIFQKFDKTAQAGGHAMKPGDKLHLRYRVLIHPTEKKVDSFFKEWASQR
jgi:methane monooxygenase PmoA-like